MKNVSTRIKNAVIVILLPVLVYLLFFALSGGKFGKRSTIQMNLKQTLVPTLISYAMCCNILNNRMDLSAGAVVMLACGGWRMYLLGVGLFAAGFANVYGHVFGSAAPRHPDDAPAVSALVVMSISSGALVTIMAEYDSSNPLRTTSMVFAMTK